MTLHRRTALAGLATLAVAGPIPVLAHDPSLHGFSMVSFEPPLPAPDFSAPGLDGGTLTLSGFRGSHVLLNFWATWCPPCLEEMPSMDALYRKFRDRRFVVLAVSSDREGAAVVRGFVDRLEVSFPIGLDPDGRIAGAYGARNLPMTVLIDAEGRVQAAAQGARDWASREAFEIIEERLPAP